MNEHDHSNRLIWGIAVVAVVFFGSVGLVWSTGGPLPSKALAEIPAAKAKAAPHTDAVAGLETRLLHLEAKMKAPPTFDSSQLEAQLKNLQSQLAAVQTQLGAFKVSDLDALRTKIDSAEAANSESVKTTISALRTDIGNLNTRFDQLSQQVASAAAPAATEPAVKHSSHKSHHSRSR
jgi:septal ring factor EnvC (AmiA/AmiB activator)